MYPYLMVDEFTIIFWMEYNKSNFFHFSMMCNLGTIIVVISLQLFYKDLPYCLPIDWNCWNKNSSSEHGCILSCEGLYADINYVDDTKALELGNQRLSDLINEYDVYRRSFVNNSQFDPNGQDFGKMNYLFNLLL